MFDKELDDLVRNSPLLQKHREFLTKLYKYLEKPIEDENIYILRSEIAEAYKYMPLLIKLKSTAEAHYRMSQKASAGISSLKGTGRDAIINGETAHYRYVRDLLEGYLDTLTSKLSAAKTILSSLDNEAKNAHPD